MIPIANWLNGCESNAERIVPPDSGFVDEVPQFSAEDAASQEFASHSREYELEALLRLAEDTLSKERLACVEREKRLKTELGTELHNFLKLEIDRGLSDLQSAIENAVTAVLRPFLEEAARSQAITTLMQLIREELRSRTHPLLHFTAPLELHPALSQLFEQLGVSSVLSEGANIDLAFSTDRTRFEPTASQWLSAIGGAQHEE